MRHLDHTDLLYRLEFLCKKRKLYPWLMGMGFHQATVTRIKKGQIPSTETLAAIQAVEGASIRWITTGRGAPYNVFKAATDQEAAKQLDTLLTDEPGQWEITLITAGSQLAVLLCQPGAFFNKSEEKINYTITEIITGAAGQSTLNRAMQENKIRTAEITPQNMRRLNRGEIGTFELLGNETRPGLLAEAKAHENPIDNLNDDQAQTLSELIKP